MDFQLYTRQYFQSIYQEKINQHMATRFSEQRAKEMALDETFEIYKNTRRITKEMMNKANIKKYKENFRKYLEN